MSIQIIPAIDLLDGSCVRLLHGDFNKCKVYELDAVRLASTYAREGAEWLHVVDLAASRDGEALTSGRCCACSTHAAVGSDRWRRSRNQTSAHAWSMAPDRVVVGSLSVTQPERFAGWLGEFGEDRLVAALDVRIDPDGTPWPRTHGWTRGSGTTLWALLDFYSCGQGAEARPVHRYRQGWRHDRPESRSVPGNHHKRYPDLAVQASGGVSGLQDLQKLSGTGVDSAITGKALLEGCFTVAEAMEALS